jgi:hypothetical protein
LLLDQSASEVTIRVVPFDSVAVATNCSPWEIFRRSVEGEIVRLTTVAAGVGVRVGVGVVGVLMLAEPPPQPETRRARARACAKPKRLRTADSF